MTDTHTGPLRGVTVIELSAIGPVPFCGLVLSDLGADVVRVDKATDVAGADPSYAPGNVIDRGRRSIGVDLKQPEGLALVLDAVERADVLVEGWRPGVAERLGIGPDECLARNPTLVYGRMTGWGREGPLAPLAGHDIDYIAVSGALSAFGRAGGPPVPPLNVVGDFGGGGLLLALGIVAALFEVRGGGAGQVVDTAMVDGSALLMAPFFAAAQIGFWGPRGTNLLDTGAPFYDCYECADGGWVAVGALEPQFYAALLAGLELTPDDVPDRDDRVRWPELREVFRARFATQSRAHWERVFGPGGHDACVAPVLDLGAAPEHEHNVARSTFVEVEGIRNPAPAPRLSSTPPRIARRPCYAGEHTDEILEQWGVDAARADDLKQSGAVA